jgi:hypothetical protein
MRLVFLDKWGQHTDLREIARAKLMTQAEGDLKGF